MQSCTATRSVAEPELGQMLDLIRRIIRECPLRQATSAGERAAQAIVREELGRLGLRLEEQAFRFNDDLHANVVLHAGLGVLGSAVAGVAPLAALGLHLFAGASYLLDGTRRARVLRRLLRYRPSQNLIATRPAVSPPRLRIVLAAHVDAALTGRVFDPRFVRRSLRWTRQAPVAIRPMALFTQSLFALAGCDLLRLALGPLGFTLRPLEALLTVPSLIVLSASFDIMRRGQVVPGANDDLSGVAALPVLAARLQADTPPDVELVFAVTGCEEPGLGGAEALARAKRAHGWDPARTVVIALDALGGGALRYMDVQGDIVRTRASRWLTGLMDELAASEPRFAGVTPFRPPMTETDAAAFHAQGYDGVALVGIDPELGAARHYHLPSDTADNLDPDELMLAVDYTERLVRRIIDRWPPAAPAAAPTRPAGA